MSNDRFGFLLDDDGYVPGTTVRNGDHCHGCRQLVQIYRRSLTHSSARVLIEMWYHDEGRDWLYMPPIIDRMGTGHPPGGYGTLGQWWGLVERMPGVRDDGSNRIGMWRLTDLGRAWVLGEVNVPKYAYLYNQELLEVSGPSWLILQALGTKFNYYELMAGSGSPLLVQRPRRRIVRRHLPATQPQPVRRRRRRRRVVDGATPVSD